MGKYRISIVGILLLAGYLISNQYLYQIKNYQVENLVQKEVDNYFTPELEEYYQLTKQDKLTLAEQKKSFNAEMEKALAAESYVQRVSLWYNLKNFKLENATSTSYDQEALAKINKRIKELNPKEKELYDKVVIEHQGGRDEK